MSRSIVVAGLACWLAALGCQQPTWKQVPTTNKPRKHVMVQFTDASLHPSVARVTAGGDVAWINYASLYTGTVTFPASIAKAFTCSDLRPLFMKTATGYQSIPIQSDSEDVTLPCPLAPGEYEYTLDLYESELVNPASDMGDPQLSMRGRIVVK